MVWLNGKFSSIDDAKVSVFDRGFLYGNGLFETMRSYAGRVFKLDEHLARLFCSLEVMRIKPPYSKRYLKDAVYENLKINGLKSAYVRLTITRGKGRFGILEKKFSTPSVIIFADEFKEFPQRLYHHGVNAKVVDVKQNEYSAVGSVKSLNFLNNILARFRAKDEGFDEAILMNTKALIAEGATSNIFLVKRNIIITPPLESGILPGITREVIIGIAGRLRLKLRERSVSYRELLSSNEVFLTNSLVEILPVAKVDSKRIGDGYPGPITKLLHISYQKEVIKEVT